MLRHTCAQSDTHLYTQQLMKPFACPEEPPGERPLQHIMHDRIQGNMICGGCYCWLLLHDVSCKSMGERTHPEKAPLVLHRRAALHAPALGAWLHLCVCAAPIWRPVAAPARLWVSMLKSCAEVLTACTHEQRCQRQPVCFMAEFYECIPPDQGCLSTGASGPHPKSAYLSHMSLMHFLTLTGCSMGLSAGVWMCATATADPRDAVGATTVR